ncbi:MAG: hypothetical protein R3B72_12795 [Polyangiaceae bacterium]
MVSGGWPNRRVALVAIASLPAACNNASGGSSSAPSAPSDGARADVTAVAAHGTAGDLTFDVTVASPDTGCDRYADWWEVVSPEGALLYRRILAHSHVDEQPFTRSGGPVKISRDDTVLVRAHLSLGGYGRALRGSASAGFSAADDLPADFAAALAEAAPRPDGCAF